MVQHDKLTLRKPLEPIDDFEPCKSEYGRLLKEYEKLHELMVAELGSAVGEDATAVSLDEYNTMVEGYSARRSAFVREFGSHLETIDDVKVKLRNLNERESKAGEEYESLYRDIEERWQGRVPNDGPESAEWNMAQKRLLEAFLAGNAISLEQIEEINKFEELENAARAAFEGK